MPPTPKPPKAKDVPEVILAADACYDTREMLNLAILTLTLIDPRHFSMRALIVAHTAVNEAVTALEDGNLTP